jgi:protein TonB
MRKVYFITLSLLTHFLACAFFIEPPLKKILDFKPEESHQTLEVYLQTQTKPPSSSKKSPQTVVKTTVNTAHSVTPSLPTKAPSSSTPKLSEATNELPSKEVSEATLLTEHTHETKEIIAALPPTPTPPKPAKAKPTSESNSIYIPATNTNEQKTQSQPLAEAKPKALICPFPKYPKVALRKSLEGVVKLGVTLHRDGTPKRVIVKESSGYPFFDKEAHQTVKDSWKFTNEPNSLKNFEVTIRFQLKDS